MGLGLSPDPQVRVWLWIILSGWWLALLYIVGAIGMCMTIVFIPFGIKAFWFAMCVPAPGLDPGAASGTGPETWMWRNSCRVCFEAHSYALMLESNDGIQLPSNHEKGQAIAREGGGGRGEGLEVLKTRCKGL